MKYKWVLEVGSLLSFSVRLMEGLQDNKAGKIDLGHGMRGLEYHGEDHKAPQSFGGRKET